jgi:hypothetical protein
MHMPFAPGEIAYVIDYTNLRRTPGHTQKTKADILSIIEPETPVTIIGPMTAEGALYWWPVRVNTTLAGWIAESSPTDIPLLAAINTEQRDHLIKLEAARLDLDPAVAYALFRIEAGPRSAPCARVTIRLEVHRLREYIHRLSDFVTHFRYAAGHLPHNHHQWRPTPNADWQDLHVNQYTERHALDLALRLFGPEPVYNATSLGPGQIMGDKHKQLGYPSALAMFTDWQYNFPRQVLGFFAYIERAKLVGYLQTEQFETFAYYYNGPANAAYYAKKLRQFKEQHP